MCVCVCIYIYKPIKIESNRIKINQFNLSRLHYTRVEQFIAIETQWIIGIEHEYREISRVRRN